MLIPTLGQLEGVAAIVGGVVTVASAFCAATPKPAAGTKLAKVYRLVEILGLVVGHAKEIGVVRDLPAADKLAQAIERKP